jgi:hypothetical protein
MKTHSPPARGSIAALYGVAERGKYMKPGSQPHREDRYWSIHVPRQHPGLSKHTVPIMFAMLRDAAELSVESSDDLGHPEGHVAEALGFL